MGVFLYYQQFAFLVMCDVWYGRLKLYTVDYSYGHKQYGRPIQSDMRSCQGGVRYSYAHKLVMCGDVR